MRLTIPTLLIGNLIFLPALAGPVNVTTGIPVAGIGGTVAVSCNLSPGGEPCFDPTTGIITFYIPITSAASGSFGTAGIVRDSISGPTTTSSGWLDLYLYFAPVNTSLQKILTLQFTDLDLLTVNNPDSSHLSIVEGLEFFTAGGASVATITDLTDLSGVSVSGDEDSQTIVFDLDLLGVPLTDPFWIRQRLTSEVYIKKGTAVNTAENLVVALQPVPEPTTMLLFGSGLLAGARTLLRRRLAPKQEHSEPDK